MNNTNPQLADKRRQYHKLLIQLGEEKYKAIIVEGTFPGIESTTELTSRQLDILIDDALARLGKKGMAARRPTAPASEPELAEIKRIRNKCLLVLRERGITSTPKDWSKVNKELEADRYQWILSDKQRASGLINKRGLMTFKTPEVLNKLFIQLCSIRDAERKINKRKAEIARLN